MVTQIEVPLAPGYVTIRQASKAKGVRPEALYMWMRRNNIECKRIGFVIVIRESDLEAYQPR